MHKLHSIYPLILCFVLLLASGCSNKPERIRETQRSFSTDIHDDGSKRFVVAIEYAYSPGEQRQGAKSERRGEGRQGGGQQGGGRRGQGRGNGSGGEDGPRQQRNGISDEDKREEIMALLEQNLAETEYCRHGYIVLEYSQVAQQTLLKGECQESASEQDKDRWG